MDHFVKSNLLKRIDKTMRALEKNNMNAYFVKSAKEVAPKVEELLKEGDKVTVGGSMTLFETGVIKLLRSGRYEFFDRFAPGITPEETRECFLRAFTCDAYLCSANAITENGELYNVDGNSNRVAALCYGPKSVILVAGYNKIVRDIPAANERVRRIAAPTNSERLNAPTYCKEKGSCMAYTKETPAFCDGCHSPARICCNYLISARQREPGRIKVIFVGEPLGY